MFVVFDLSPLRDDSIFMFFLLLQYWSPNAITSFVYIFSFSISSLLSYINDLLFFLSFKSKIIYSILNYSFSIASKTIDWNDFSSGSNLNRGIRKLQSFLSKNFSHTYFYGLKLWKSMFFWLSKDFPWSEFILSLNT